MGLTLHDVDNRLKDILDALQGTRWRTKEETRTRTNRSKRPADLPGYYGEGAAAAAKERIRPPDDPKISCLEIYSLSLTQAFEDTMNSYALISGSKKARV
jgi:hypothetical protein